MTGVQRTAALALVLAGFAFVGFFLAAAPDERSFALLAREVSFTPTKAQSSRGLPALREPSKLHSLASSETRVFDGKRVPEGRGECRFGPAESAREHDVPQPAAGVFLGLKLTQPQHCQLDLSWKGGSPHSELAFRTSGKSDCALASELIYANAIDAQRSTQALPALPGWSASCGGADRGANLPGQLQTMRATSSGWLTTQWRAPSFVVWDTQQQLAAMRLVLSKAATFGEPGDSCNGEPGDQVKITAREIVLSSVEAHAEGLALPIQVSSNWHVEVGGCQTPRMRKQFTEALAWWFQLFVALGGVSLLMMTFQKPAPACKCCASHSAVEPATAAAPAHESDGTA